MSKSRPISLVQARAQRDGRSVEVIAAETNKKFGVGTVVRASDMLAPPPRLNTGSLWFDLALGGGLPQNAWSEVVGVESSGKTAFVHGVVAHNMKVNPDFEVLWCASENYDAEYAAAIGVDLSRCWLLEENTMELVYDKVVEFIEERSVDMAVIDSYPSLITDAEDVAFIGDAQVSPGARLTGKFMRKAAKATKRSLVDATDRPCTGVFINQWRNKVGVVYGDPRTTPGGVGKNYWFTARVEVRREDYIKDSEDFAVGQRVRLNTFKNKASPPRREGECDFYFDDDAAGQHRFGEWDDASGIIKLAESLDVVERKGNTYTFDGLKLGTTKEAFKATVRSDPELLQNVRDAIWRKELGSEPPAPAEEFKPKRTRMRRAA